MNAAELERLEFLLDEILHLDPIERQRRVAALASSRDPIAPLVIRLVERHERGHGTLITPPDRGRVPEGFNPLSDPLIGRTLGDFTILRLIGVGGMGRVYEARQHAPARSVAIKILSSHAVASDHTSLRRFRREADALGALDHPNICKIHSAGTAPIGHEIVPYLAMEYLDGVPLDQAAKALGLRDKIELIAQVADGAHAAHLKGIVHRDLKPANVLVLGIKPATPDSQATTHATTPAPAPHLRSPLIPKIVDFGVSGLLSTDTKPLSHPPPTTLSTEPGRLIGTLAYMSPERLAGHTADARADVYSIGVMLFELLIGRRPFDVPPTGAGQAASPAGEDRVAPRLREIDPSFGQDLEAIVALALEPHASRRYESAAELAEDVRRVLAKRPVSARLATRWYRAARFAWRRRRELIAIGAAMTFVAIATGLALYFASLARVARATQAETERARSAEHYVEILQRVEAALYAEDVPEARSLLDAIKPPRRGWEWSYLDRATRVAATILADPTSDRSKGVFRAGERLPTPFWTFHTFDLLALPFDQPDGKHALELTDLNDPTKVIIRIDDLPSPAWRVGLTRDRQYAILAGILPGALLEVYDVASRARLAYRPIGAGVRGEDNVLAVSVPIASPTAPASPEALVAIGGEQGIMRLFSIPVLESRGEIRPGGKIDGAIFSPDGTRLAITSWPDGLAVFDPLTREKLVRCDTRGGMPIYACFSDDGSRLASLNYKEGNLNLWDATTGRLIRRQPLPSGPMALLSVPGANRLAVGSEDGSVRLFPFDVTERGLWTPTLVMSDAGAPIRYLSAAPNGTAIGSQFSSGEWMIWRIDPPR